MFRIAGAPAVAAANPKAAIDLKTFCAVRINQFDRRGAFPGEAVPAWVCVNAVRRVKQIRQVGDDAVRGNGLEIVHDGSAVGRGVHHVRVHPVIHDVRAPTPRPTWWWRAVGRLANHVVQENVRLRVHVRRLETAFERGGPNHRRAADRERTGVGEAVGQRRFRAVCRVSNRGVGGGGRDGEAERRVVEASIHTEFRVAHERDEPAPIGRAGSRRGKIIRGAVGHLIFHQLRHNEEVGVAGALVQSLNCQDIAARQQRIQVIGYVDVLKYDRLKIWMRRDCRRIPLRRRRRVAPRNFLSVQTGYKTVVIHHPQGERLQGSRVGRCERNSNIRRRVYSAHLRLQVGFDERPVAGRTATARHDRRSHGQPAGSGVADEPKVCRVPRRQTSLRGVQLHFRTSAAFVVQQAELIISRRGKIERLQSVARPARTRKGHAEAAYGQAKPVVTVHAESPVAGRWNRNCRRRFDHEIVLIRSDGETRERTVVGVIGRGTGVEVVDHWRVFRIDSALLGGRRDDALRGRQIAHADVGHIIVNREARDRCFVADAGWAARPTGVVEAGLCPSRAERAAARDENLCRRPGNDERIGGHVLRDAEGNVWELFGKRRGEFGRRRSIGLQQREIFAARLQAEIRVQRLAQHHAIRAIREYDQEAFGGQVRAREKPAVLVRGIVRERPSVQIHRARAAVVNLDPIGKQPVLVGESGLVVGHEFADIHLRGGRTSQKRQTNPEGTTNNRSHW